MRRRVVLAELVVVAAATAGCSLIDGSASNSATAKQDAMGDPYITNAQGQGIAIGMSAAAAFRALGGKSPSGYNGIQAVPPLTYDYPVRGTGNPDSLNDSGTIWWQICVEGGRVVGKVRGTMSSLPAMGC